MSILNAKTSVRIILLIGMILIVFSLLHSLHSTTSAQSTSGNTVAHIPGVLEPISSLGLDSAYSDVYVKDQVAHLLGDDDLTFVDVSNPANPSLMATYDLDADNPYRNGDLFRKGDILILSEYYSRDTISRKTIIDMTTPTNPVFSGFFDGSLIKDIENTPYILGSFSDRCGDQLELIDLTDPRNPISAYCYSFSSSASADIVGNIAYLYGTVEGFGNRILTILDIADPTNPQILHTTKIDDILPFDLEIEVDGETIWIRSVYSPSVEGSVLTFEYRDNSGNYGIVLLDVSDPTNPRYVDRIDGFFETFFGRAGNVGYSYQSYDYGGVGLYDWHDPYNIIYTSYGTVLTGDGTQKGSRPFVNGDKMYVSWTNENTQDMIDVVDISDITAPTSLGVIDPSLFISSRQVGDYVYRINEDGFEILHYINSGSSSPQPPQTTGEPCPAVGAWPQGCNPNLPPSSPPPSPETGEPCPVIGVWPQGCNPLLPPAPPPPIDHGEPCPVIGVWPAGCNPNL